MLKGTAVLSQRAAQLNHMGMSGEPMLRTFCKFVVSLSVYLQMFSLMFIFTQKSFSCG